VIGLQEIRTGLSVINDMVL